MFQKKKKKKERDCRLTYTVVGSKSTSNTTFFFDLLNKTNIIRETVYTSTNKQSSDIINITYTRLSSVESLSSSLINKEVKYNDEVLIKSTLTWHRYRTLNPNQSQIPYKGC
jgi:septin family protein